MAQQNSKSKQRLDWELLAKDYGIADYENLENRKLFKALQDKTPVGKSVSDEIARVKAKGEKADNTKSAASTEVKSGEVLPPGVKSEHAVHVHAPQIHNHIASPNVTYGRTTPPQWHEVVQSLWTIALHMVLGAAVYAVVSSAGLTTVALLTTGH